MILMLLVALIDVVYCRLCSIRGIINTKPTDDSLLLKVVETTQMRALNIEYTRKRIMINNQLVVLLLPMQQTILAFFG